MSIELFDIDRGYAVFSKGNPLSDHGKYFLQQYDLVSRKSVIVNPPELNRFYKKGKFDISLILDSAGTNRSMQVDFYPDSIDMVIKARAAGVPVELHLRKGQPHNYPVMRTPEAREARAIILQAVA